MTVAHTPKPCAQGFCLGVGSPGACQGVPVCPAPVWTPGARRPRLSRRDGAPCRVCLRRAEQDSRTAAQLPWGPLVPLPLVHMPFPRTDFVPYPFPVMNLRREHDSMRSPSGESVKLGVVWGPSTHVSPLLMPLALFFILASRGASLRPVL